MLGPTDRRRQSAGEPRPNRVWEAALKAAELRHVTQHSLRHTYASLLIAQGENPEYISKRWGTPRSRTSPVLESARIGTLGFPDKGDSSWPAFRSLRPA